MAETPLLDRRSLVLSGAVAAAGTLIASRSWFDSAPQAPVRPVPGPPAKVPPMAAAKPAPVPAQPKEQPKLVREALAALDRHGRMIPHRDRIAIVDFSSPSSKPRMQLLDIESGKTKEFLVAHGSGSDPGHTGFLHRFSNQPDSNASSQGAFVTANYYVGKHGRSQRLLGLDPTNNNALERAIVVHGAWYAEADMIRSHGKLGRSQGCFAVGDSELAHLFERLGTGRMIYAARG
jgi:L,D-transpeptidase catalytic domain